MRLMPQETYLTFTPWRVLIRRKGHRTKEADEHDMREALGALERALAEVVSAREEVER
jgi:hypothetical protein